MSTRTEAIERINRWREHKDRERARRDAAHDSQKTYNRTRRKLSRQQKSAVMRAKYGPTGKPAPVVVKSLTTGEVRVVVDQSRVRRRRAAA
jgi:hypothetical protein